MAHRNLEPKSIYVFRDGKGQIELKIAQFGFARCIAEHENSGTFADISTYKSPEYMSELIVENYSLYYI